MELGSAGLHTQVIEKGTTDMSNPTEPTDPVVFLIGDQEVSNDRRWYAQKAQEQEAQNVAARVAASQDADLSNTEPAYESMKPLELKELAKARNLSLAGITKKSQVIALLQADDATKGSTEFTGQDMAAATIVTPLAVEPTPADEDEDEDDAEDPEDS